jgi:mannosyltransferase OCH1-like enzyme
MSNIGNTGNIGLGNVVKNNSDNNDKLTYALIVILVIAILGLIWVKYSIEPFYEEKSFRIQTDTQELLPRYPKSQAIAPYKQHIPFVIHQTYYSNQLGMDIYQTCMTIKNMNPEYEYAFYDDQQCRAYIQQHYPPEYLHAYDSVIPGAYKADIFRYLLLYREGGIYMDCKSSTIVPLRDFIPRNATFAVFRDRPTGALLNSFMAVTPNHPIVKRVIELTMDNVKNKRYNNNSLDITGPQTLGRAFNLQIGRDELADIEPGAYGRDGEYVILGSFYVFGEGEKEFDALVDAQKKPLVAKTLKNYYNNAKRIDYHVLWANKTVFKD